MVFVYLLVCFFFCGGEVLAFFAIILLELSTEPCAFMESTVAGTPTLKSLF